MRQDQAASGRSGWSVTLPTQRRRAAMRRASHDLLAVLEDFARQGQHPVRDVIAASDGFVRGAHYPAADVEDAQTGCAWYYHAHEPSSAMSWDEHGHFHCFMYTECLGRAAQPIALPEQPDFERGGLVHIAALSFDANGTPTRLFIPNRWVTDEWLYPARDVIALIDRFTINSEARHPLTSRFLSAILRLLQPQIAEALRQRDRVLRARGSQRVRDLAEDRSIQVVSSVACDL